MKKSVVSAYLLSGMIMCPMAGADEAGVQATPQPGEPAQIKQCTPPLVMGGADAEVVKVLLSAGVNVHAKDARGWSLLHEASACGNEEGVRLLLEAGSEVRDVDNEGNTALHLAVLKESPGVVTQLLEAESDVNAVNKAGDTPLIIATRTKNAAMVRLLLAAGADASLGNYADETPLAIAYALGWEEGLQILQAASPKR